MSSSTDEQNPLVAFDDVAEVTTAALICAADWYEPTSGISFDDYADQWVDEAIRRCFRCADTTVEVIDGLDAFTTSARCAPKDAHDASIAEKRRHIAALLRAIAAARSSLRERAVPEG